MTATREVYALRYGTRGDNRAANAFYRYDLYGLPDSTIGLDYFFWVVRTSQGLAVFDCGFTEEVARSRNRVITTPPHELLARIGVDPTAVDHVVLSHMHFDHVGNIDLFPNATVHIARQEHDYWTGRHRGVPTFSWPVEPADVEMLAALGRQERLVLVDESAEILPGVHLQRFPGHTPGQLVMDVAANDNRILLTSDAVHYYDELRLNRPIHLFTNLEELLDSYQVLRELDAQPEVDLVPGHDPGVTTAYAHVEVDCIDLTQPFSSAL